MNLDFFGAHLSDAKDGKWLLKRSIIEKTVVYKKLGLEF